MIQECEGKLSCILNIRLLFNEFINLLCARLSVCTCVSAGVFTNFKNSPKASHVTLDVCLPGRLSARPGLQEEEQGSRLLRQVRKSPRLLSDLPTIVLCPNNPESRRKHVV